MSEHSTAGSHGHEPQAGGAVHATAVPASENRFSREELAQFDSDDTTAGRNIGKMLAIMFLYTIIVMSLAAWWTFRQN